MDKIVVLGLGKAGLSDALYLKDQGFEVICWDDNEPARTVAKTKGLFVTNKIDWKYVKALVISPGIPHTFPQPHPIALEAKNNNINIWGDVELLFQKQKSNFIGITGTNGKSTTSYLIYHVLKNINYDVVLGGNFGTPAVELGQHKNYVLEMSSYMLELCPSLSLNIAILLNISSDHLERHGGIKGYINAKSNIFNNQSKNNYAIISIDDKHCLNVYNNLKKTSFAKIITISCFDNTADFYLYKNHIYHKNNKLLNIDNLKYLKGLHNIQNILSCFACCYFLGMDIQDISHGIKTFKGLEHRQEHFILKNNVQFINDSKATNTQAAAKSLQSYDNIIWLAGGQSKQGGIQSLLPLIKQKVKHIVLYGQDKHFLEKQLKEGNYNNITIANTFEQAINIAYNQALKHAKPNNIYNVLLAPACASWDMFKSFEDRGTKFKNIASLL